jgi:alkaline phosphatase
MPRHLVLLALLAGCSTQEAQPPAPSPPPEPVAAPRPRGVVLIIGDGTATSHLSAAQVHKGAPIAWHRFDVLGLQTTSSADHLLTDSAAAATALATGHKTNNGHVGVDPAGAPLQSVLHAAEARGLATGVVVTSRVTHATPAAFVAHQPDREDEEAIANDFLAVELDVVIGGGRDRFDQRADGQQLSQALTGRGVHVVDGLDAILASDKLPLYGFIAPGKPPKVMEGRAGQLAQTSTHAFKLLSADPEGFFLLVEGSQVDWAGHDNDGPWMLEELLDLDQTVAAVLDAAGSRDDVLVIATGDHETGGVDLLDAEDDPKRMRLAWNTDDHSATMVPVFAKGPGAERFGGLYDNTDIARRIAELLELTLP